MATDLAAELFVPLLLAVLVLLLHVLGEVEDGVKQESTQIVQQAPLLLRETVSITNLKKSLKRWMMEQGEERIAVHDEIQEAALDAVPDDEDGHDAVPEVEPDDGSDDVQSDAGPDAALEPGEETDAVPDTTEEGQETVTDDVLETDDVTAVPNTEQDTVSTPAEDEAEIVAEAVTVAVAEAMAETEAEAEVEAVAEEVPEAEAVAEEEPEAPPEDETVSDAINQCCS